ncbi:MAG: hypothetical protein FWG14_12295 [Peptococcaceae bacterium]|nr:hypothetical protein [Peptococcaceae bacterium]
MPQYTVPHYIEKEKLDSPVLLYLWDDTQVIASLKYDTSDLIEKLESTSLRAKTVLAIGIYEWIIWRYHLVYDDPIPVRIDEASWCAAIDKRYIQYVELVRSEYTGPIKGPLWVASMNLVDMFYVTPEGKNQWRMSIHYLSRVAMHILPDTKPFEQWLDCVTDRLLRLYPEPEDNPFEDLFNNHEEERRGPLVAREALDPSFDYHPDQAPELLDNFLRSVDHMANPFLRSPEELMELGIEHPYRVLP